MLQISAPPLPALIALGSDTYNQGDSHPNRYNINLFDLIIVTKGCLYITEDSHSFVINEKTAFLLYSQGHHYSTKPCDKETHFYWFHFNSDHWVLLDSNYKITNENTEALKLKKLHPFLEYKFSIRLLKKTKITNWDHCIKLCEQLQKTNHEVSASWNWQQQLLFQQLLQLLSSQYDLAQSMPSIAIAEKVTDYIKKNFKEKITYGNLAEELSFHPNHIARCLKEVTGYTPIDFINKIRLDHAKLLLISTQLSIESISEECGFSQIAYFTRIFKKNEGTTPSSYRKQYLGR